jgi:hypothetical protein
MIPETRGPELDSADRAPILAGGYARAALGALERHIGGRGKSDPTGAILRRLRHEATAGWALIHEKGDLLVLGRLPGGISQIAHMLEVLDDVPERPGSESQPVLGSDEGFGRRRAPGPIGTSRASREGGAAMLAPVQLERGEFSAFPTQDARQGAERLHDPVDVAPRSAPIRPLPNHRRTVPHKDYSASRFSPNTCWSKLVWYDNQDRVCRLPSGVPALANLLNEAPILDRPE